MLIKLLLRSIRPSLIKWLVPIRIPRPVSEPRLQLSIIGSYDFKLLDTRVLIIPLYYATVSVAQW